MPVVTAQEISSANQNAVVTLIKALSIFFLLALGIVGGITILLIWLL